MGLGTCRIRKVVLGTLALATFPPYWLVGIWDLSVDHLDKLRVTINVLPTGSTWHGFAARLKCHVSSAEGARAQEVGCLRIPVDALSWRPSCSCEAPRDVIARLRPSKKRQLRMRGWLWVYDTGLPPSSVSYRRDRW